MRIWDIAPSKLCRNHLLGEHRELHAIWVILTENRKGYRSHPETLRWKGRLKALFLRHEKLVKEMAMRGYRHRSALSRKMAKGRCTQNRYVNYPREQVKILRAKQCGCAV